MPSYTETFACDVCCGTTTTTVGPSTTMPPGACFGGCTWYCNGEAPGVYYWQLMSGCNAHPENANLECSCDSPQVVFNTPCDAANSGDITYTNCTGATTTTQSPVNTSTTCDPQACGVQSGAILLCIDDPFNLGNCYWTLNIAAQCFSPCTIDLNILGDPCGECGSYTGVPCSCDYS